jgi:hypothetical protein
VFVFPGDEKIARHCREYGIELVRPFSGATLKEAPRKDKIPILRFPVEDHKQAVYLEEW